MERTRLSWLRIGTGDGLFEKRYELSGCQIFREFLHKLRTG
jgi:hypothetical protein